MRTWKVVKFAFNPAAEHLEAGGGGYVEISCRGVLESAGEGRPRELFHGINRKTCNHTLLETSDFIAQTKTYIRIY